MAKTYAKNNRGLAKSLFEKRLSYSVKMAQSPYKNLVDFNFGEKYLYGRVNRFFVPMVVRSEIAPIKKFNRDLVQASGAGALPFVVDAFNDLAQQFQKCAMSRKIDASDPFLTNLKVYKAYESPKKAYRNQQQAYFGVTETIFKKEEIKVKNFDEFMTNFMLMLESTAPRNPFTQPGFVKSSRASITSSGLAIEIANLNASNDQEKINQFVNSNNWNFYVNACASYGFMVDRQVPWRLVADIGIYPEKSPMMKYAAAYGLETTDQIINIYYKNAYSDYYQSFKESLLSLYNRVKLRNFLAIEECEGKSITKRVTPTTYTSTSFFKKYSEEDFLTFYFNIRFLEEESPFTEAQQKLLIGDCIELYLQHGLERGLGSFERILNKPFDYRGSLGYIKKHLQAGKAATFEESQGVRGATSTDMGTSQGY
jgi:hypothetical protein